MTDRSSGGPQIVSSLLVALAILGAGYFLSQSIDRAAERLAQLTTAVADARPAAPSGQAAAAAPSRRPDPERRYEIAVADAPVRGPSDAAVTIIEWSDFQCPFCARVGPTLDQVQKTYGDRVRIVFKHLPLSIHPKAPDAHAAAEAAHRQGKFWEMHDRIFGAQREMSTEKYLEYAAEIGLDVDRFKRDVASPDVKKRIDDDSQAAAKLGVTGTPSLFINGRFLSGAQPFESFKRIIDEELSAKG